MTVPSLSGTPSPDAESRINPRRVEWVALVGMIVQALAAVALGLVAHMAGGRSLSLLAVAAVIGVGFWFLAWLHLRLRRLAEDEAGQLALAERQRRMAGMERLFDEEEDVNQAARNLRQMEQYLAPAASVLLALALFAMPLSYFAAGSSPWGAVATPVPVVADTALVAAAVAAGLAVALFLCGMYAAGLAHEKRRGVIRAGGGYMLVVALFSLLSAMAMGLAGPQWKMAWPDQVVAGLILAWATLQGLEILVNLVLNIYRPRVAGVEARPAYDSRLSGLFAEPTGILRTFAHTLDYQFGFKISETWFFQFLERAFAPLLLIGCLTFYLMTCLVVVRPGEVALIERFGAPRGVTLPAPGDEAGWDALSVEPLGPGLHVKWPWPMERARIIERGRMRLLYAEGGHGDGHDHDDDETPVDDGHGHAPPPKKKKEDTDESMKLISWSDEHGEGEFAYLMPKPASWMAAEAETHADDDAHDATETKDATDASTDGGTSLPALPSLAHYAPLPPGHSHDDGHDHSADIGGAYQAMSRYTAANIKNINVLLMAGSFALQWRVGDRPSDVYRFAYVHVDPVAELSRCFNRELTRQMAGAEFWDLFEGGQRDFQARVKERLAPVAARLGVQLMDVKLQNTHPPAGDVGKAFQEVLAARERKNKALYDGMRDALSTKGAIDAQVHGIRTKAETYAFERVVVSQAEADRFGHRLHAYEKAPGIYEEHLRLQTVGRTLGKARVYVVPGDVQLRLDDSRRLSDDEFNLLSGVGEMIRSENN